MSCWWRGECFAHLPGCSECVTWMIVSKFVSVKKGVVRKGNFHVEVGSGVFVLNKYFRFFFGVCMWEQLHTDLYLGAQTCAFNVITCYLVLVSESVVLCIQRGIYIYMYIDWNMRCMCKYIYILLFQNMLTDVLQIHFVWMLLMTCKKQQLSISSPFSINWIGALKKNINPLNTFFLNLAWRMTTYTLEKKRSSTKNKSAGKKYTCFNPPAIKAHQTLNCSHSTYWGF